jgi:hypothetical protein
VRVVDDAIFEALEDAGFWVPALHEDETPVPEAPEDAIVVHDGYVAVDTDGKTVLYPLPFVAYYSSVGDDDRDDNPRLIDVATRRSVYLNLIYVGADRRQAKWAGEKVRAAIGDKRLTVAGFTKTWKCKLEESQRIRRDDDAARPDGSPLFYGVDNYAVSIALKH